MSDSPASLAWLYHGHLALYPEDLPFWCDLARQAGAPALELGCGSGRVLLALAQAGIRAAGLDLDPAMLAVARQQIPPDLQPQPALLHADMADYQLPDRFGLILSPCNTLSLLDAPARQRALACACRHLRPGGLFAAVLPNPAVLDELARRSKPQPEDQFIHPLSGNPVQVSSGWRFTKTIFRLEWIYDELLPDGSQARQVYVTRHHLTTYAALLADLSAAGLVFQAAYGDYDRSPYTADAPQLILVAAAG